MNILAQKGTEKTCPTAVFLKEGKVLSGLRHYTPDKWKAISVWTFPGGRCDAGETIEQTLRREVAEEINITDFQITKYLGTFPGAKEGDLVPAFLCTTMQSPKLMEPEKFSEWKWFPAKKLPENFINPHVRSYLLEKV
ncbi:NUDIX hydrolase [Candidatus Woesearchaeota archaeon]|nr:NUDIX hydrolase [Candidatus Woesearchaeota archaeon]